MNKAMLSLLSEPEVLLVLATEPAALALLDEDETGDLLLRVRRARTKYSTNYRRQSSKRVVAKGARGAARGSSNKTAEKAEIFEDALARVSRRLAALAKAERRRAARGAARRRPGPRGPYGAGGRLVQGCAQKPAARRKAPLDHDEGPADARGQEARRFQRASGARRQAARDTADRSSAGRPGGTGRARPGRRPRCPGRRRSRRSSIRAATPPRPRPGRGSPARRPRRGCGRRTRW